MVGDVVLTPFPYTDLSGVKVRPVVVLAEVGMEDWVVCEIICNPQTREGYIPISDMDMDEGGLRLPSYARVDRLYTLNESVFRRTLGRVSAAKMEEIAAKTRALF